jgi:hypothetical protein
LAVAVLFHPLLPMCDMFLRFFMVNLGYFPQFFSFLLPFNSFNIYAHVIQDAQLGACKKYISWMIYFILFDAKAQVKPG